MIFDSEASFGAFGYLLDMILTFLLALILLLIVIFVYAKYGAKKSQETGRRALTEKEREKAGKIEETGYSERDEIESDDSGDFDNDGE